MVSEILGFSLNKGGGAWLVSLDGTRICMVKGRGSEGFLRY